MKQEGGLAGPLRVAIVGSGPAGFYAAEHLLKQKRLSVSVDMFDRLPTPFGLVRFGVAPDHQKIKKVTRVFDRVASNEQFRFFGNVEFGSHINLADLRRYYHQICFATGAQSDRRLGIPGEDLARSHPATEFVAWYNGHPDFCDARFDLSVERVAVIGVGNVAVDVARMLCRTKDELSKTDIADYALEALGESRVRQVFILGRRGPAQAAFTNAEIKELGELPGADIVVIPGEVALDRLSQLEVDAGEDAAVSRKVAILQEYAGAARRGKERTLTIRFLVSPAELLGDDRGGVAGIRLVQNELYQTADGSLRPRPTDQFEDMSVDLVFRSVGYRGVSLPDLPFDETRGIIPNDAGRIVSSDTGESECGLYVAGWIKRGPTGVIGTNKPDAAETVTAMVEDAASGILLEPDSTDPNQIEKLVVERQRGFVSYDDWRRIDEVEMQRGTQMNRPRVKFTSTADMMSELRRVL
jgi:ferredoxin--NADP+ reductase